MKTEEAIEILEACSLGPAAREAFGLLLSEINTIKQQQDELLGAVLPDTFYTGRSVEFRVQRLVEQWQKMANISEKWLDETVYRVKAEHQRDKLMEAVLKIPREDYYDNVNLFNLVDQIQSGPPKGEWIAIKEDGSNMPERVEGAEWFVKVKDSGEGWVWFNGRDWTEKKLWPFKRYEVVAYWSIPHIDRRPDIPAYQPEQNDQ